ncbi:hypothetical protein JQS30_17065 (plasmid) [Natronoglycomyces albus]|uniref:SprT-like family protein n=1 Tax=Natronoglycomyces albus TaxID=2811108 RepID=A0A895XXH6_9ACTN|nr:hypothetical protein JQS30_17065 [Natronoglycomyces albus]
MTVPLITALQGAWDAIQARHDDVPPVVITLGAGSLDRGGLKLGHFAADRWHHAATATDLSEVFIGGEGLERGSDEVLATLLHEAAHVVANVRGIQDTSRQGRWHNKKFKALAEELGLTVTKDDKLGWSPSQLAEDAATVYADTLQSLNEALTVYRRAEIHAQPGTKGATNTVQPALCGCPRRIRVAPSVLEEAPIVCGSCGQEFQHETADAGT